MPIQPGDEVSSGAKGLFRVPEQPGDEVNMSIQTRGQLDYMLFVASYHHVLAFDIRSAPDKTLKVIWKVKLNATAFPLSLICHNATLFVGCGVRVYSLNALDGSILWESELTSKSSNNRFTDIYLMDDHLIATCGDLFFKLTLGGQQVWKLSGLKNQFLSTIAVSQIPRTFYITTVGEIHCVDDNGNIMWTNKVKSLNSSGISACEVDGNLIVGGYGKIQMCSVNSGKISGDEVPLKGTLQRNVAILEHQKRLYLLSLGRVFCLNPTTLELIWKNKLKGMGNAPGGTLLHYTTQLSKTNVLFVAFGKYVIALNADNGQNMWHFDFSLIAGGSTFISLIISPQPTLYEPDILWAGGSGHVIALDATRGTEIVRDNLSGLKCLDVTFATNQSTRRDQQSSSCFATYHFLSN